MSIPEEEDYEIQPIKKILAPLNGKEYKGDGKKAARRSRLKITRPQAKPPGSPSIMKQSRRWCTIPCCRGSSGALRKKRPEMMGIVPFLQRCRQKIATKYSFVDEFEQTGFATTGYAQTADGRSLSFNVEVGMSRSFMAHYDSLETKEYIKTDPRSSMSATTSHPSATRNSISTSMATGKRTKISMLSRGSGFLALDKNGDGLINDGSESSSGPSPATASRTSPNTTKTATGGLTRATPSFRNSRSGNTTRTGPTPCWSQPCRRRGYRTLGNADTEFSSSRMRITII